jgi:hypothetical protein
MSEIDAVSRIHRGLPRDLAHGPAKRAHTHRIVVAFVSVGLELVRERLSGLRGDVFVTLEAGLAANASVGRIRIALDAG